MADHFKRCNTPSWLSHCGLDCALSFFPCDPLRRRRGSSAVVHCPSGNVRRLHQSNNENLTQLTRFSLVFFVRRGLTHWPWSRLQAAQLSLVPLFDTALRQQVAVPFDKLTTELLADFTLWCKLFEFVSKNLRGALGWWLFSRCAIVPGTDFFLLTPRDERDARRRPAGRPPCNCRASRSSKAGGTSHLVTLRDLRDRTTQWQAFGPRLSSKCTRAVLKHHSLSPHQLFNKSQALHHTPGLWQTR